jgi:uncharacterized NAD(P)/FAD-binding protein YdhS
LIPLDEYRPAMRSPGRTIAIIGAGFSGTVLAVNLLRRASADPTRIVLIERRAEIGRGVAYQRGGYPHLLNVPAARMSADSREPMQFVRFAQARDAHCQADQFLPRRLYGEYLQELLQQAARTVQAPVSFEQVRAEAQAIYRIDPAGPYLVSLSNQQRILADDVVLAGGDPPPAATASATAIERHPSYICDPCGDTALRPEAQTVLLVGSGLTMADVAIATVARHPQVQIHAISRHGLLPREQTLGAPAVVGDLLSRLPAGPIGARAVLRAFRSLLAELHGEGGDWRDAINSARQSAPLIWRRLSHPERARFLRHLRAYWDVHRHRMAPVIDTQLTRLRERGQLQIHAGHLLPMSSSGDRILVRWRPRGCDTIRSLLVDRVVNCAGSDRRLTQTREPLLRSLIGDGLAVVDPLGLGWQTGEHGALIDRHGAAAEHLFYIGPMLRARHWEATAVGELRGHAEGLADALMRASTDHSRRYTSLRL